MRPGSGAGKVRFESTLPASLGVSFRGGIQAVAKIAITIAVHEASTFLVVTLMGSLY